jgi:tetratricopeptide (TPR) repeat protein
VLKNHRAVKSGVNLPLATWRARPEIIPMLAVNFNAEEKSAHARALCEQGLWSEVLDFAQKWRSENPGDYKPLFYMGLGFSGHGQFVQAETAYRQALALDAADPKVWNNLGKILFENLQRPKDAILCIERMLKLDPGSKLGWANLAVMVGELGLHDQALLYAGRAIALDPKFVEAYLHKAAAARVLGKTEVVKEVCEALAAIEPEKFRRPG